VSIVVDIRWPLASPGRIPIQHQYPLLAALSRVVPSIHETEGLGIHPIRGAVLEPGKLELTDASSVTIRVDAAYIPALIPLSGKRLDVAGFPIRLGIPRLLPLRPSERLGCRFATIKGFMERDSFLAALRRQLDTLEVRHSAIVELGKRQILRVKQHTIVGFGVIIDGLREIESMQIQVKGAGGRRHLGAGLFMPISRRIARVNE
jgi:CRISPR-associated protein Cas6